MAAEMEAEVEVEAEAEADAETAGVGAVEGRRRPEDREEGVGRHPRTTATSAGRTTDTQLPGPGRLSVPDRRTPVAARTDHGTARHRPDTTTADGTAVAARTRVAEDSHFF
ncbi:hypothetical protein IW139_004163 [Coemansia sp. RSA 353]|nr:hypothetical protein IW143_002327 [Coemansia sp. RSA 520]KAJ2269394.1 hypothetical protein J3F81_004329 [Coemansia sp. RSA 371]KAJ2294704.1 hypothetical protein IW139_004163 [Coemansia sp. RSA 353]